MSDRRSGPSPAGQQPARTPFQRDQDRILFSNPFRRLADKTQVFPLPPDDHVHSRLTHTLEVAAIGRSLGTLVGHGLLERHVGLHNWLASRDFGDCVAAACLAHDLGNPPFGHVGEDAIREFFATCDIDGTWSELTQEQRGDFENFEGNAQTFRIVTRTERPLSDNGLQLTHATLGALVKYPCTLEGSRTFPGGKSTKKHGLFSDDVSVFAEVADSLGLAQRGPGAWQRHPLALLSEAADDIAYLLLDLEDGLRLGYVSEESFVDLLRPLCEGDPRCPDLAIRHSEKALRLHWAEQLRAIAVDLLIGEMGDVFMDHHDGILDGSFDKSIRSLVSHKTAMERIEAACLRDCYRAPDVLRIELAGAEAIQGLLRFLLGALDKPSTVCGDHLHGLLPALGKGKVAYDKLHQISDHVSGMTDRYCVRVYRELLGVRYPGTRE